eukprot:scaffold160041_cov20-Tisochrysis_lutea.AAC.1
MASYAAVANCCRTGVLIRYTEHWMQLCIQEPRTFEGAHDAAVQHFAISGGVVHISAQVKAVLGRMDTLGAEVEALLGAAKQCASFLFMQNRLATDGRHRRNAEERRKAVKCSLWGALATVERGVPRSREPCIAFDELEELEELAGTQEVAPAAAAAAAAEGSQQQQAQGAEAKAKGALAPEEHVGREGATAEPQQQQQRVQEAVSSGPGEGQLAAVMGQVQAAAAASAAGNAEGAWTAVGR